MIWDKFSGDLWKKEINVEDFILHNYKEYTGDDQFLVGSTERTMKVWKKCEELEREELKNGILDVETHILSGIDNFDPGYIDRDNEVIVGLQTDAPLKRIVNPYGGMRMVDSALSSYGYSLDSDVSSKFNEYRKTHNQGVFDAYTSDILKARKAGLITGLPDAYGRGRIIGDYRRIALYGIDHLIVCKKQDLLCLEKKNYWVCDSFA